MDNLGILLIHGFAGSRQDIRPLYDSLKDKGYTVVMPVLAGHEGTKKELSSSKYFHWVESVDEEFLSLRKTCDKIIVIGFSMGGLLAVNLYAKYKFDGLITINTPIYYWDIKRIIKNLVSDFKTYSNQYFKSSIDKPLPSLIEFQKLLSKTKPIFQHIKCPALIMQTMDDDTVNPKSGNWIYDKLRGEKESLNLSFGGHVVINSSNSQAVVKSVEQFIDKFKSQ